MIYKNVTMDNLINKEALLYHSSTRPGKIEIKAINQSDTIYDLPLAYATEVVKPCLKIKENPENVYNYTIKGNLVAIITNGSSIKELGNMGALASKPMMEEKAMVLKKYAGIDAFDIELNTNDIDVFVRTVITMSPTFGAINLAAIKAPECFEIERRLIDALDIPVLHDNQHGTAIVSAAALINACEIAGKNLNEIKLVINGAGASAIACAELYLYLGLKKENLILVDSKGVLSQNRIDLDKYKQAVALNTNYDTLEQAIAGADAFIGLSKSNLLTSSMVKNMAENPIVFALAKPTPEIGYTDAINAKEGVIYASSCTDFPNTLNNTLGFPYVLRAALDVRASKINLEMKKAAAEAIASLAKKPYTSINEKNAWAFGRNYFIPVPSDNRLISTITPVVAKAAIRSGVARLKIKNWDVYIKELTNRI